MNQSAPYQRKIYFDILRIIAIFFVIFNHTGTRGYFLFSITTNNFTYWIYLFLSVLCKLAVPLFFMISGALLLPKNESIKKIYSKRILKYIIVILFFSFLWYLLLTVRNASEFSIATFLAEVYSTSVITPYWFLYSYLAVLMMLPFIRKMAQGMNQSEFIYLFVLFIVFTGVLPVIQFLAFQDTLKINLSLPIVTAAPTFYMMIGYFVEQLNINKITKKHLIILVVCSIIGVGISCLLTYYKALLTGVCNEKDSQAFHGCFTAFPTITIYLIVKKIFSVRKVSGALYKIIASLGSATFGIYLFEAFFREKLNFLYYLLLPYLHTLPSCIIYVCSVMLYGYLFTILLKQVPYIKKLF